MSARRSSFHHYGPWLVAGTAILVGIAYEATRHHLVSRESVIVFLVLIPTIILHEIAHGVVAYWCGDDTAKRAGRLSLNPLRHIDPIGSVLLPILLIVTTGSAFGWAKPVPVNIGRLRHPRNQAVLVGLAGPATNLLIAAAAGAVIHAAVTPQMYFATSINQWPLGWEIVFFVGYINVVIAAFNLIPIPPLDGASVVERLLPASALPAYYRIRPAAMVLVIAVVFLAPGVLDTIFNHAIGWWEDLVFPRFSYP
jgi:Zn-dependent protease